MATNQARFIRNDYGALEAFRMRLPFQAGSTQAFKKGEMGYLSTNVLPVTADLAVTAALVIVDEEIKAGDLAGYYNVTVPRPGDVFEFAIDTAAATALGTSLKIASSGPTETLSATGSNEIAVACGQEHYPNKQGHMKDGDPYDAGTTIRSTPKVRVHFKNACSYWAAIQT